MGADLTVPDRARSAALPRAGPARLLPPYALSTRHFGAALLWLALGAAGLVVVAPVLAEGGLFSPRTVAVTHCFTLGWITTSIFGALYHIYPVALGVAARSLRVAAWTFWTLQLGIIALVAGSWFGLPALLAAGWLVLFAAVGGFSWNVLPQRRRARRGRTIGLYVSAGHMGLGLAMVVAGARIGEALGWWQVNRLGLLSAHVHLAVVGFATLTAVGVGSKLLPMFLRARNFPVWPLRWIGPVVGVGLLALAVGQVWSLAPVATVGGALTAGGITLFLYQAGWYFRARTRVSLDPTMAHVAVALVFLAASTAFGVVFLSGAGNLQRWTAYGALAILGWLTLLVAGVYYRVVPFLTWLHHLKPGAGRAGGPTPASLSRPQWSWLSLGLLAVGVMVLTHGIGSGGGGFALAGAWLWAAGVVVVLAQHVRTWWNSRLEAAARSAPAAGLRPGRAGKGAARDAASARLDVRPILAGGGEPLERILGAAARVPLQGVLEIVAPFEPIPLYRVLALRGFAAEIEARGAEEFVVRFTQTGITSATTLREACESWPAAAAVLAARGLDACCGGMRSLEQAAAAHGVPLEDLLVELHRAVQRTADRGAGEAAPVDR